MKEWGYLIIFSFIFTLLLAGYKTFLSLTHPIKFQLEIIDISAKYDLDPTIIASVINVESSYDVDAVSSKNALGLMQIKLSTAQYMNDYYGIDTMLNEEDLLNPLTNIEYGCMYIRYLLNKFDNIETSLCAYNAGETRVRVWLRDNQYSKDGKTLNYVPYQETNNYIKKIKNNIKFYKDVYKNF